MCVIFRMMPYFYFASEHVIIKEHTLLNRNKISKIF